MSTEKTPDPSLAQFSALAKALYDLEIDLRACESPLEFELLMQVLAQIRASAEAAA